MVEISDGGAGATATIGLAYEVKTHANPLSNG
jgi:hypothetical protein